MFLISEVPLQASWNSLKRSGGSRSSFFDSSESGHSTHLKADERLICNEVDGRLICPGDPASQLVMTTPDLVRQGSNSLSPPSEAVLPEKLAVKLIPAVEE